MNSIDNCHFYDSIVQVLNHDTDSGWTTYSLIPLKSYNASTVTTTKTLTEGSLNNICMFE